VSAAPPVEAPYGRTGPDRFLAGDPLRALAVLGVLLLHLSQFGLQGAGISSGNDTIWNEYGHALGAVFLTADDGVFLFFALSGYLIGRPFLRSYVVGGSLPSPGPYLRNRLVRIVPPFWAAVVLTLVVFGTAGAGFKQVVAVFGFAQDWEPSGLSLHINQGWSLSPEVSFYLVLPAALWVFTRAARWPARPEARALLALAVILILALVSHRYQGTVAADAAKRHSLPATLYHFAPGLAWAALEHLAPPRIIGRRWGPGAGLLLVIAGLACVALSRVPPDQPVLPSIFLPIGNGLVLGGCLLPQWSTGGLSRLLNNRPLHWLGIRSYSLYLVHLGTLFFIADRVHTGDPWESLAVVAAIGVPGSLLLAVLLHRFVERPFLRLRATTQQPPEPAPLA
jgi:peptidoglycan/LPS O-acetylase OafA/YrhL